ncbi:hypothetical protein HDV64DRAFT_70949 [Trichoderma sp. TUCIM 5745]
MPCPDLGVETSSGAWGDLWRLYLALGVEDASALAVNVATICMGIKSDSFEEIKALRFIPWVYRAQGPWHGQDEAAVTPCTVLLQHPWISVPAALCPFDVRAFTHPVCSVGPSEQGTERVSAQMNLPSSTLAIYICGRTMCASIFNYSRLLGLASWTLLSGERHLPGDVLQLLF